MWVTLSITTLIKCINDKDKSVLRVVRKGADEINKERAFHQLWSKVWVILKVSCYNHSKRGEEYGEFMDESGKDGGGLGPDHIGTKSSPPLLQVHGPLPLCRCARDCMVIAL